MICPQCSAELEFEDSREYMFCTYCGTKVLKEQVVNINVVDGYTVHEADWYYDNWLELYNEKRYEDAEKMIEELFKNFPLDNRIIFMRKIPMPPYHISDIAEINLQNRTDVPYTTEQTSESLRGYYKGRDVNITYNQLVFDSRRFATEWDAYIAKLPHYKLPNVLSVESLRRIQENDRNRIKQYLENYTRNNRERAINAQKVELGNIIESEQKQENYRKYRQKQTIKKLIKWGIIIGALMYFANTY